MALIRCPACEREISADAGACPGCGQPNKPAQDKAKDSRQHVGCAVMVGGAVIAAMIHPGLGLALLLAGLIYAAVNTRFK